MFDIQYISNVEGSMLGVARLIHSLYVDVARRRHQKQVSPPLGEDKCRVADLTAW